MRTRDPAFNWPEHTCPECGRDARNTMSDLARQMIEDPDNKLWDAPAQELHTSCYFKQNSIEISVPSSPTAWIEADAAYNLQDMR